MNRLHVHRLFVLLIALVATSALLAQLNLAAYAPVAHAQGEPTPTPAAASADANLQEALGSGPVAQIGATTAAAPQTRSYRVFLPLVRRDVAPDRTVPEWLSLVNAYRQQAGVPQVVANASLSAACEEHARYMAENNHLTHYQNPELPWASAAGERCANKGNAWMGPAFSRPLWTVRGAIDGWMGSVGHRLWLLYPTSTTFGYGFYTAANNRSGAALDVLSQAHLDADAAYSDWPVRYPTPSQASIPAKSYPITLQWPYFGPAPTLEQVRLTTLGGSPIPFTADTALPVGHKGIQIIPTESLPTNTTLQVTVAGLYAGSPFSYSWQFTTGGA